MNLIVVIDGVGFPGNGFENRGQVVCMESRLEWWGCRIFLKVLATLKQLKTSINKGFRQILEKSICKLFFVSLSTKSEPKAH